MSKERAFEMYLKAAQAGSDGTILTFFSKNSRIIFYIFLTMIFLVAEFNVGICYGKYQFVTIIRY